MLLGGAMLSGKLVLSSFCCVSTHSSLPFLMRGKDKLTDPSPGSTMQ